MSAVLVSSLGVVLDERRISGDQKVGGLRAESGAVIVRQDKGSHKSPDPDDVRRVAREKVTSCPVSWGKERKNGRPDEMMERKASTGRLRVKLLVRIWIERPKGQYNPSPGRCLRAPILFGSTL